MFRVREKSSSRVLRVSLRIFFGTLIFSQASFHMVKTLYSARTLSGAPTWAVAGSLVFELTKLKKMRLHSDCTVLGTKVRNRGLVDQITSMPKNWFILTDFYQS